MTGEQLIVALGKVAEQRFGLTVGENPHFGGVEPVHTEGSFHYQGTAIDVTGPPARLAAFNRYVARYFGGSIAEMFYDPGINLDSGQRTSAIGGHGTHVHVATYPGKVGGQSNLERIESEDILGGAGNFLHAVPGFDEGANLLDKGYDAALGAADDVLPDAASIAAATVGKLADLLGVNASAIMLNVALVGGGAMLVYYGIAKAAGVDAPVRQFYGRTPTGAAVEAVS